DGTLPVYRVLLGGKEHWFATADEADAFRRKEQEKAGRDLVLADDPQGAAHGNGHGDHAAATFFAQELHEVRGINRGLERLREFNLDGTCVTDAPRIAGREPPPRFVLENGDQRRVLPHLRELVPEVRRLGERGLTITRFKGLG